MVSSQKYTIQVKTINEQPKKRAGKETQEEDATT